MDAIEASLIAGVVVLLFLGLLRSMNVYERLKREQLETDRARASWYQQMQRIKTEKGSKKSRKRKEDDEDDDQDDEDELDELIEAARPYAPFLKGVLQARKIPVDVDALLEHDPREKAKVELFLEQYAKKNGSTGGMQHDVGGPIL